MSLIKNENISEDELAAIVQEHPYYSVAQFQLLRSYNKSQHKNFESQASLTALFFNNSRWLNWRLSHQDEIEDDHINNATDVLPVIKAEAEKITDVLSQNKNEELLAFEPLHTVDYFASQGIKITEEALTNDKLGTQLKSFTEWLKSMKKINAEKPTESDEQTEKVIQHIAESSNANINFVTEAMAEVLLKQGKTAQAIDMYQKLSLNYPNRSAYFASKINSLKSV